jgi:hypothetical protein
MATYDEISRIAKILARATSNNEAEAVQCIKSAYARMKRDGVTLEDLLTLPVQELYQATLNRLVDYIINLDTTMSPSEKRRLYAKQIAIITLKFLEEEDAGTQQEYSYKKTDEPNSGTNTEPPKGKTRAEEAQGYHERHGTSGYSDTAGQGRGSDNSNTHTESTNHADTEPPRKSRRPESSNPKKPAKEYTFHKFNLFGKPFSFSPARFFDVLSESFGQGSFLQRCLQNPFGTWNLIYCSLIFSLMVTVGLLFFVGIIYSAIPFPVPNVSIASVFGFICAIVFFSKVHHLYLAGWFD